MIDSGINIVTDKTLERLKDASFQRGINRFVFETNTVRPGMKLASLSDIEGVRRFNRGGGYVDEADKVCDMALLALRFLREKEEIK